MEGHMPESQSMLEPVFPIYLDVEMLTGFLATLEGGFSFSSDVASTGSNLHSSSKSGQGSAGTSGLLNQLFRIDFNGNLESSESFDDRKEMRFVLQHTEVSLFNRLRRELYDLDMIQSIDSETESLPALGSIVEFEGVIRNNPLAQVLNTLEPLMDILDPSPIDEAPAKKPKSNQGRPRIPAATTPAVASSSNSEPSAREIIKLLTEEQARTPLLDMLVSLDSPATQAMILTLRRTSNIEEANAHFLGSRCMVLGKVSGYIAPGESVQLYRRSILAVLGESLTRQFFSDLGDFNINLGDLTVNGPALQILPVAIYV